MTVPIIRVAVVDDEPLARRSAVAGIAGHADLACVAEYADGDAALAGLRADPVDLVLLDVQMPGCNGLGVLAALVPGTRPLAILLTAHDAFAVQAFALGVVDYLLKPVEPARLDEALDRARERLRWRQHAVEAPREPMVSRFAVRVGRRTQYVAADAVDWIAADGDYARLHADGREYLLRESLNQLASQLDPTRFVRVHRSAIVRVDQVAELQPLSNRDAVLRLRDGTPVRASRTYMDALLAGLAIASPRD